MKSGMFRALALALVGCLAACTPTLNWREVPMEGSSMVGLMPCKPDRLSRSVPFVGGKTRTLTMLSCEVDGATFAITMADMGDPSLVSQSMAMWDKVTRDHVQVVAAVEKPLMPPGADPDPNTRMVTGKGVHPNGQPMQVHMAYFAKGPQIFQAVLYAPVSVKPVVAETFLEGLKFR